MCYILILLLHGTRIAALKRYLLHLRERDKKYIYILKMVDEAANVLPGSFPMVGGDGNYSYAKNSYFQVH